MGFKGVELAKGLWFKVWGVDHFNEVDSGSPLPGLRSVPNLEHYTVNP